MSAIKLDVHSVLKGKFTKNKTTCHSKPVQYFTKPFEKFGDFIVEKLVMCPYHRSQLGPMLFGYQCSSKYLHLCFVKKIKSYMFKNDMMVTKY